jgi:hypothetical protein
VLLSMSIEIYDDMDVECLMFVVEWLFPSFMLYVEILIRLI